MFEKLRALRISKGIPVEKLAEVLGLETLAAYYKKENGSVKFTLADAKKYRISSVCLVRKFFLTTNFPVRKNNKQQISL